MDNLTKITDAAGKESSFTYDLEGNMTSFTDANGDSTYTYDLMNRITSVTSSDGRTVKYTYDEADNLVSITYPDGRVVSYEYDLNDRLVKVTDGDLVTTYAYDAAGRVTETIRPYGSKSVYEYNEKDEIVSLENKTSDDKVESSFKYEYDATGNILKEEAKNDTDTAVRTYEYNEADELTGFTEKSADTNIEYKYEYDGNGNLIKKTGADNDVSYEYTVENRLKAVKSGGELLMAAGYDGDGNRIFQVTRNSRDFEATNPQKAQPDRIKAPDTGDNNWYLEAFLYGVWQGTANNLAAYNSSLAVKYTEDLRDEWDDFYHGRTYDKEAGEIDFSKDDMSLLKNAGLSDEEINTITSKDIEEDKLEDDITIPGATYDVSEKYYDLTRYVNDVNTENTEVLQEYTQSGSLKSSHVYGNERIYSDVYDPASDAFNVSTYNYDGRRSVAQTSTGNDITGQLLYDPFGNMISGETVGASTYGFNAEEKRLFEGAF